MAVFEYERDDMKKSKRSVNWQDPDIEPSGEMRFDLNEPDVDEILELEDMLELPKEKGAVDDGVSALDNDITLDNFKLDPDDVEKDFLEDRLTDDLIFDESKLKTADSASIDASADATARDKTEDFSVGFDETSFLRLDREARQSEVRQAVEAPAEKPVEEAAEGEPEPSIEDLVKRIETRLLEAVQQAVEARLPDIVRNLLREEIERVKKEMEADRAQGVIR